MQEDAALFTGKDTIAAISTAVSEAGIGIIRISGPEAFSVGSRVFRTGSGREKDLSAVPSHTIHYGAVFDGEEQLDEVLVSVMRAPRTYTAEDTVEINCHGGIYTLQRCLRAVLGAGARLARPGEFTQRAFLNGRIDLTRAEAVMDVIQARNDMALRTSLRQLGGSLFEAIRALRGDMLGELAFVEAALDDPEHYSLDGYAAKLGHKEAEWEMTIRRLLSTARGGRIIREGIRTAIVGRPNAGKSSLMNRLAGKDLSIVTSIPGTTRDIVRETLRVGEAVLLAEDTAGIREASDPIEQIGVERAMGSAREADLVLCVLDTSEPLNEWDHRVLGMTEGRTRIILLNKSDLEPCFTAEEIRNLLGENNTPIVSVSAADGTGMDRFEEILLEMFYRGEVSMNDETVITNERQQDCLEKALSSLLLLREGLDGQMPEDLLMVDLADAVDALGRITGETVQEDLYNEIFDRFCMGK